MKIYIYTLSHPITGEIRYVGKTKNPKMRFHNHCNKLHNEKTHKRNWINSLYKQGLRPIMEILDEVEEINWKFWEKYWISQIRTWGFNLVNHTLGGDGLTMGNQTSFKKGCKTWNTGTANIKMCEVCNKEFKIPKSNKQRTCSIKCSLKIKKPSNTSFKKGHKSWNKGISVKIKPDKNVYQFNKERTIMIKKWNTAREAGEELNINIEGIGQCARGKSKSCGNFYWNYENILK